MPKQVYKIDQFHGGLNNNADMRDVADNEFTEFTDCMVDELGKIRTMGGPGAHASETSLATGTHANEITSGYGLYAWNSDRTLGDAGVGGVATAVASVDDLTPSVTAWQASQVHTNVEMTSSNGIGKKMVCNIITDGSGNPTFVIVSGGVHFIVDEQITFTDPGSTSNTAVLIVASLEASETLSADDTGENYLAFSDSDSTGDVRVYSFGDDSWGNPITGMTNQTGGTRKDVFYAADGELRICDSNFGNSNLSKWYGYINKSFFQSIPDTVTVDQWYLAAQEISSPDSNSQFDQAIETTTVSTGHTYDTTDGSLGDDHDITENTLYDTTGNVLNMMGGIEVTVRITTATYSEGPTADIGCAFTITVGSANLSTGAFLGVAGTSHKELVTVEEADEVSESTKDIVYTFSFGDFYHDGSTVGGDFANGETGFGIRTTITDELLGEDVASIEIRRVKVTEETTSDANSHSLLADGGLSATNLHLEVLFAAPDTSGAKALGWDKIWEHGVSFIYDGKQESLIRQNMIIVINQHIVQMLNYM